MLRSSTNRSIAFGCFSPEQSIPSSLNSSVPHNPFCHLWIAQTNTFRVLIFQWLKPAQSSLSPLNGSIQHNPFCHLWMPQSSAIKSVAFDHIASVQVAMLMVLAMAVMVLAMAAVLEIWRRWWGWSWWWWWWGGWRRQTLIRSLVWPPQPISIHLDRLLQPNSRQLAATRDDIHQHWWRHSPRCMGIALVQIQLENSAFSLKQHHFLWNPFCIFKTSFWATLVARQ